MSDSKAEGSAVPPSAKGSWSSFLRSITSFSGDLSSLTAPPFILSSTSLVEFSAYWTEHPGVFVAPAHEPDPAKRALLVLKWFLTTLKQQYASRSENLGSEKKPLNPFLGELFLGRWEDEPATEESGGTEGGGNGKAAKKIEVGTTQLVSEQVSHHPPVTAYCIWNPKNGVRLQGYNGQRASISRTLTISVKQIGHATIHIDAYDEDYLITLPNLHIEGLYSGSPFTELNSSSHIVSSSGFVAKIDYGGRGWISGKKNSFSATLSKYSIPESGSAAARIGDPIYTIEGQWTAAFHILAGKGGKSATVVDSWDPETQPTTRLTVAPLESQDALESRRAWHDVAEAISRGDMDATAHHKSLIENAQREMRKKEKEEDREWERTFFSKATTDGVFERLAKVVGASLEADKTNGVWLWDADKAREAKPPFGKTAAAAAAAAGS